VAPGTVSLSAAICPAGGTSVPTPVIQSPRRPKRSGSGTTQNTVGVRGKRSRVKSVARSPTETMASGCSPRTRSSTFAGSLSSIDSIVAPGG
jgi:hypothetical protein